MFRIAMMAALGWRFGNFISDVANAATRGLICMKIRNLLVRPLANIVVM